MSGGVQKNPFTAPHAVFVMGPTASGKSAFALRLAQQLGGEIVSADSMQIYRGLDIGTAKESAEMRAKVPHSMIDVAAPDEEYSVARYREEATAAGLAAIRQGRLPVFAGGTGLYFESLFYPLGFGHVHKDPALRNELEEYARRFGNEALYARLTEADAEAAAKLHPNDVKRVVRALEVALFGSATREDRTAEAPDVIAVKFEPSDRQELYRRIDARVDEMFAAGLADEIARLSPSPEWQSMQAIGYKEFMPYADRIKDGEFPLSESETAEIAERIKQHTRNYAKRQLTWFRRYSFARSFDVGDFDGATAYVLSRLGKRGKEL